MSLTKNQQIRETLKATREKRANQECHVFKIKIDESSLNKKQEESLEMQFVEAKWIVNEALASADIFKYVPGKTVVRKDKDMNDITTDLRFLGSQIKQKLVEELKVNIKTLSTLKKKGKKVGKIKFKREVTSLELSQYGSTHRFIGKNKLKIQNVPGKIRINGLHQILSRRGKLKYDLANAKLLNTPLGYYVAVTCYKSKEERRCNQGTEVGIDFGISTNITLSDGRKFNACVQETDRLRRLQRQMQRQTKGSKRRFKTLQLIKKEYQKLTNKKNDIANKIVSEIKQYQDVYMQDENINGWKSWFGKTIQHSVLGRIKAKIKPMAKYVLSRWEPTTKLCTSCGQIHKLSLSDRMFICDCGVETDRDVHAAMNMIVMSKVIVGQELAEFTLRETMSDLIDVNTESILAVVDELRSPLKGLLSSNMTEAADSLDQQ